MTSINRVSTSRGVRYRVRYRTVAGASRSKTFPRKVDAERFAATVASDQATGQFADPMLGRVALGTFVESWFAEKQATVSASTVANVQARLDQHILPRFATMRMADIRPHDVRSWVAELTSSKHLAPATVKAVFGTFRQIMATAEIDGVIARSPCVGIKLPRDTGHQPMTTLTADELLTLSEAVDDRYRVLILTAGYTGLRAGELGALRLEHVDLEHRRIYVRESIGEVNGRQITGPTKSGVARTVSLPEFLARELGDHMAQYPSADGYVFTTSEGGPIRHRNFMARHYKPAVRQAGLPTSLRFHDLRHTAASLADLPRCEPEADPRTARAFDDSAHVRSIRAPLRGPRSGAARRAREPPRNSGCVTFVSRRRGSGVRAGSPEAENACDQAFRWSGRRDSNPRPQPWQGCALPAEPRPRRATRVATRRRGEPPQRRPRAWIAGRA